MVPNRVTAFLCVILCVITVHGQSSGGGTIYFCVESWKGNGRSETPSNARGVSILCASERTNRRYCAVQVIALSVCLRSVRLVKKDHVLPGVTFRIITTTMTRDASTMAGAL
jgi:hypothetical protein